MDNEMLADFRLVALHGGFGRASRSSGRPKATLSKRVIELEANLGVRLFDRTSRDLHLTDEGHRLCSFADELADAIDHLRDELRVTARSPRGKLRVAAPSLFTYLYMGKFAASFLQAYPDVELETVVVEPPYDHVPEFFDVLIKVNPPTSSDLVGRVFARDTVRIVGSPKAVAAIPDGLDGATLSVPAIAPTGTTKLGPWDIQLKGSTVRVRPEVKLHLPSRIIIRDAVSTGLGLAELPAALIFDELQKGSLLDLGPAPSPDVECWVLYASRRLVSRRISTFVTFLCDYFKETPLGQASWQPFNPSWLETHAYQPRELIDSE